MKQNQYITGGSLNHLKSLSQLQTTHYFYRKKNKQGNVQVVREERGHIHHRGKENQTKPQMKVIKRNILITCNLGVYVCLHTPDFAACESQQHTCENYFQFSVRS